jgi:sugar-specific transcriptional regulator TrmB
MACRACPSENHMHPELLRKFGFTEKEAVLYLALLQLGRATARDLATQAGLNRSTTYAILQPLAGRGLVSIHETKSSTWYAASPPEYLVTWLHQEAYRRAELAQAAEALLPQLHALARVPKTTCLHCGNSALIA